MADTKIGVQELSPVASTESVTRARENYQQTEIRYRQELVVGAVNSVAVVVASVGVDFAARFAGASEAISNFASQAGGWMETAGAKAGDMVTSISTVGQEITRVVDFCTSIPAVNEVVTRGGVLAQEIVSKNPNLVVDTAAAAVAGLGVVAVVEQVSHSERVRDRTKLILANMTTYMMQVNEGLRGSTEGRIPEWVLTKQEEGKRVAAGMREEIKRQTAMDMRVQGAPEAHSEKTTIGFDELVERHAADLLNEVARKKAKMAERDEYDRARKGWAEKAFVVSDHKHLAADMRKVNRESVLGLAKNINNLKVEDGDMKILNESLQLISDQVEKSAGGKGGIGKLSDEEKAYLEQAALVEILGMSFSENDEAVQCAGKNILANKQLLVDARVSQGRVDRFLRGMRGSTFARLDTIEDLVHEVVDKGTKTEGMESNLGKAVTNISKVLKAPSRLE